MFELIDSAFLSSFNLDSLGLFSSIAILVALGQLMVLAIGQFNLAIGAIGACGAIMTAFLMQDLGVPVPIAILAGLLTGIAAGIFQGLLIAYTPLNPFVITLALASVYLGAATGATRAGAFDQLPPAFDNIGSATLIGITDQFWLALGIAVSFGYCSGGLRWDPDYWRSEAIGPPPTRQALGSSR